MLMENYYDINCECGNALKMLKKIESCVKQKAQVIRCFNDGKKYEKFSNKNIRKKKTRIMKHDCKKLFRARL